MCQAWPKLASGCKMVLVLIVGLVDCWIECLLVLLVLPVLPVLFV